MLKKITYLALFIAMFLNPQIGFAENNQGPIAGRYESLDVAYDKNTKKLSAVFVDYVGWNENLQLPQAGCELYIEGKYTKNHKIKIKSWYPHGTTTDEVVTGTIEFLPNKRALIFFQTIPMGCEASSGYLAGRETDFDFIETKNWKKLQFIKTKRAYFYNTPNEKDKTKKYVIKKDMISILEEKSNWVKAEYIGYDSKKDEEVITIGWLKKSNIRDALEPVEKKIEE